MPTWLCNILYPFLVLIFLLSQYGNPKPILEQYEYILKDNPRCS